ncbi:SsgA family sporulation/cell division regulator [Streptomyces sp. WMMB303]|uniref:SsgA family sporulation/cell division regulator n=1 Tax=unclassified Streptomyces TaxID=2593676 RepID=UPI0023ED23C7|nr:SsgA family sporulation/cell division regulator [Streptomyces sp. WMMB303]MDF4251165.1 SsgA family sporulation/cell division regulator [Streptomyces sp. WMMB303]
MSKVITRTVQAQLIVRPPAARPLNPALRYETDDPLAVRIVFPAEISLDGAEVAWAFSRDLLAEGLRGAAGEGDVQVRPGGRERTVVELHAGEGVAVLDFRTCDLERFLRHSYELVPAGAERALLDLEEGFAALLRGV